MSHWLPRGGRPWLRLIDSCFRDWPLPECQLDELWTFVDKKEAHLPAFEKLARRYGDPWIGTAFDPVHTLVPTGRVGKRPLTEAQKFSKALNSRRDSHSPFLTREELPHAAEALWTPSGVLVPPPRRFQRGRPPSPRLEPPPDLVYAGVLKEREHGRVTHVATPILSGTDAHVAAR